MSKRTVCYKCLFTREHYFHDDGTPNEAATEKDEWVEYEREIWGRDE